MTGEASLDIAQPVAAILIVRCRFRCDDGQIEARTVIPDFYPQPILLKARYDFNAAGPPGRRDAVFDGILHESLNHHGRNPSAPDFLIDVDLEFKPRETGLFDFEIRPQELHFIFETCPFLVGPAESVTEDIGQSLNRLLSPVGLLMDQTDQGV